MNLDDILVAIGNNIKTYRERKKINQEALGKKIGMHQSQVSRIEKGIQSNFAVSDIYNICNVLDIGIEEVLSTDEIAYLAIKGEEVSIMENFRNATEKDKLVIKTILSIANHDDDEVLAGLIKVWKSIDQKHQRIILDSTKEALKSFKTDKMVEMENKITVFSKLTGTDQ